MTTARGIRLVGERAFVVFVWTAAVLNLMKGVPHAISEMGFPYWTMTYGDGFIRRGLVGTVVHEFISGYNPGEKRAIVLFIHAVVTCTFWVLLYFWARHVSRAARSPRTERLVVVGAAGLFLSQLPSTTVALASYLDIILLSLAAGCAYHAIRGRYRVAALIGAVGPFVHEAFVFLWLPIALILARRVVRQPAAERRAMLGKVAPLVSPLIAAALTMVLHSPAAATKMIANAPVDPVIQESFRVFQYGLGVRAAFSLLAEKYAAYPSQLFLASAFFLPPIAVTAACAYAIDRGPVRWKRALFAFVVSAAPCSILVIAWDLSRFLLWSGMGAFFLLVDNALDGLATSPADGRVRRAPLLVLAAMALFSTGPHVYAYFEIAYAEWSTGPGILRWTPAARVTYAFLSVYNRMQRVHEWSSERGDKCMARGPGVEKLDGCSFIVRPGQYVETSDLWLEPGTYEATVRASPAKDKCPTKDVTVVAVMPHFFWRFEKVVPPKWFTITEPTTTTIGFVVDDETSVMGRAKISIDAVDGCVRVDEIRVRRTN